MITLLLGMASSGKTREIMERIGQNARAGIRSILIVPEQYSHDAERELCRFCGNSNSSAAEVLSFTRLASRVFAVAGGLSVKPLDNGGRVLLMNRAMQALQGSLRLYRVGKRRVDFISDILSAYDELSMAGTGARELRAAGEQCRGSLHSKLLDLADLFEAYEALIPAGFADPNQRMTELCRKLSASGITANCQVYLDGFTDFTHCQMEIIREMARLSDVTAALTCSGLGGEEMSFLLPRTTALRLQKMASDIQTKCHVEMMFPSEDRKELLSFAAALSAGDTKIKEKAEENSSVSVYRENSKAGECETAAAEILRCARDYGWRYRDMAVAVRGYEDYGPIAESIFAQYGIPVMVAKKEDILEKPVMAMATAPLHIVSSDWEYKAVMQYLKTGLSPLTPEESDALETYILKWNIRGRKMWTQTEDWRMHPKGYNMPMDDKTEIELASLNALRRKVAEPVAQLEEQLEQCTDGSAMTRALYAFLKKTDAPIRLAKKAEDYLQRGEMQLADETSQLWEILVSAIEQCAVALEGFPAEVQEFERLIRLMLSQYDVGSIPVSVDRVGLGDLTRMKKRGLKLLILMGATADRMPRIGESTGVFSDEERDRLCRLGLELSDNTERRLSRELGAVYNAVSLPGEKLVLTYSPDGDGKIRPSYLVSGLTEKLGVQEKTMGDLALTVSQEPCIMLAMTENESSVAAAAREYFKQDPIFADRMQTALQRRENAGKPMTGNVAMALYREDVRLTASRVEKISTCQYSYYLQYGLKLQNRRKAVFDAPEIGTYMHYILENTVRRVEEEGGFRKVSQEKCREIAREYCRQYIDTELDGFYGKSPRFIFLFNRLARETEQVAADLAREMSVSQYRPLDFELEFSPGGQMPAAGVEGASVSGKVDRVDGWLHGDRLYLRVVDYKTGRKVFHLSDVWYGQNLQMLLYLFTLQQFGQNRYGKEIVPAGVLYVPARDGILRGDRNMAPEDAEKLHMKELRRSGLLVEDEESIHAMEEREPMQYLPVKISSQGNFTGDSLLSLEKLGQLQKHIEILLTGMGREIRKGQIRREPCYRSQTDNGCTYCDYRRLCHVGDSGNLITKRPVKNLSQEEFWEKIGKEIGHGQ